MLVPQKSAQDQHPGVDSKRAGQHPHIRRPAARTASLFSRDQRATARLPSVTGRRATTTPTLGDASRRGVALEEQPAPCGTETFERELLTCA